MESTAKNNSIDTEPKLTERQWLDIQTQQAIEECERYLKSNPKWYTAEELLEALGKIK